jgi:hypothetical protein
MEARRFQTCLRSLGHGSALAALAAVAFSVPLRAEQLHQQTLNICELVRHAERYQNRVVTISGFYNSGQHGVVIANEHCGFRSRYRAFGWGAAAAVEYDLSAPGLSFDSSAVDRESLRTFSSAMADPHASGAIVRVTVLGVVQAAEHYSIEDHGDSGATGTGYGFMGRYPLQITILAVKSFSVTVPKTSK